MIDLSPHIEYLLLRHDCVVVPGFGAFLIHESSARYDSESGLFMPPSRSLGFNPAVNHNDGLLVESVSRRDRVSIEAASQKVQAAVAAFRHQLSVSDCLPVGRLGVMSKGSEPDVVLFEPSADSVPSVRYRGLLPLAVKPVVEDEREIAAAVGTVSRRPALLSLPLKIAASVILLLVACGLLYTTGNLVETGSRTYASLDSGIAEKAGAGLSYAGTVAENVSREIILNIARPVMGEVVSPPAEPVKASTGVSAEAPLGRYLLVVASLPSRRAAERHIASIGAADELGIIDMDGKYRVYAASSASIAGAQAEADRIRVRYPNVWVCKR